MSDTPGGADPTAAIATAVLSSGRTVHGAAGVLTIVGVLTALLAGAGGPARWAAVLAVLLYVVESWLALRVALDAELFGRTDPPGAMLATLDQRLVDWRLRSPRAARPLEERARAAVGLWKLQLALTIVEAVVVAAAIAAAIAR